MFCPLCQKPTTWTNNPWRPFCSERCQMTDLGNWAAEQYRIAAPPLSIETDAAVESESRESESTG
ncbi:MAG: DNA gyrase inhibitor YacG [Nitrospira sp.]|nr:DNA gyrase inhibitor YacG [Nitrospira sp.]